MSDDDQHQRVNAFMNDYLRRGRGSLKGHAAVLEREAQAAAQEPDEDSAPPVFGDGGGGPQGGSPTPPVDMNAVIRRATNRYYGNGKDAA